MNKIRNHSKELIVLTILLAIAVSVVNAAVFVYYPINITASWSKRPLYFAGGTNAGGTDLSDGITVSLSNNDEYTSATITVHPSRRGTTRYKDVLRIVNSDTQAYYIGFNVTTNFDDEAISVAQLIVRNATTGAPAPIVGRISLKDSGVTWVPWPLDPGKEIRIDLVFTISSGSEGSDTAVIDLVYSPTTESPEG